MKRHSQNVRPTRTGLVTIFHEGKPRQVEMTWGLEPFEPGGKPISLLRWEGREIERPCLVIANDFALTIDGAEKYRASLITDAAFFCIAGVWRPGRNGWPEAYAALTTRAYPDLAPYKDRHVAVIRKADRLDWLRQTRPVAELLRPFPVGSFTVDGPAGRAFRPATPKAAVGDLFDRR